MADDDDSQRTEDPTQRRLDDAHKRGQVAYSREITSFLILVMLALLVIALAPSMMRNSVLDFTQFIEHPEAMYLDDKSIITLTIQLVKHFALIVFLPLILVMAVVIISGLIQTGFVLSTEPLMPKWERISPIAGFKRIFSMRSMVELVKGCIKIVVVGVVGFLAVYPELGHLQEVFSYSLLGILMFLGKLAARLMIGVCSAMGVIAVADLLYQRFEYMKSLRMSRQDIRDEFKHMEGNPEVKSRLRDIRNQRARKRMMAAVPTADVVVTNPTHYSVALKYDTAIAEAPMLVAKGQDFIALRIREVAKEHNIPIVENAPLARALFSSVEIDQEIPVQHYMAVAEIIRYVYKLKGKKL